MVLEAGRNIGCRLASVVVGEGDALLSTRGLGGRTQRREVGVGCCEVVSFVSRIFCMCA